MSLFESYERRIDQIIPVLNKYGIESLEEAKKISLTHLNEAICYRNVDEKFWGGIG